jgi:hypothetical protein
MFDVNDFYSKASGHEPVDPADVLAYIRSFDRVILWGAANFGAAIGSYLIGMEIPVYEYWDLRAGEIGERNGVRVTAPFPGCDNHDKSKTLVILCINNNVLKSPLWQKLEDSDYPNILKGEYLYMGAMCPFTDKTGVRADVCIDPLVCRFICCERLSSITAQRAEPKAGPRIDLVYVCILVNSLCSMNCKGCVQYINNYPAKARTNVPTERVCADIRAWLGAVDSIGGVSVMGGETFMHPGIDKIAQALSGQSNFGLASFPTSGSVPLDPHKMESFRDPRLSINFGNYERVLTPRQKDILHANVELVKGMGLSYTMGNPMNEWIKPSTLYKLYDDPFQMYRAKQSCAMPPRNMQAKNGKIFPCDLGVAINNIGIADYPRDYVDIENTPDLGELREKIRRFIDKPFYQACSHCNGYHETCEAMVQGHHDYTCPSDAY